MNIDERLKLLKEVLELREGDIIYILSHKKKNTMLLSIIDFLTGAMLGLVQSYKGGVFRYLIATTERGVIYQMDDYGQINRITDVMPWTQEQRDDFKAVTIDGIKYKKIRKVLVD